MAKRAAIEFERELWSLFNARTHWLVAAVKGPPSGKPPIFSRKRVTEAIERLQDLASKCVADDLAEEAFNELVDEKWQWHVTPSKGWGWREKREIFNDWFEDNIPYPNCVYIFWGDGICRYVGRTRGGRDRPRSYFEKRWFPRVKRIDIYSTRRPSELPKLECLAIHRFEPTYNRRLASTRKWTKRCPVCELHDSIRYELRDIFGIRR